MASRCSHASNGTRARIQDTAVTAEALIPDGPYNLWRKGETTQRVKTLVDAFAQFPQLPKMLNRTAILDTLVRGCEEGAFVLRLTRPDKSVKTYWREKLDEAALKDPALEVVLPDSAEITALDVDLLTPQRLPGLWTSQAIAVQAIYDYFAGGKVVKVNRGSYEEPVVIPKASPEIVDSANQAAVKEGKLWLTAGPASLLSEEIPAGVLSAAATVQAPPEGIPATQLLPQNLSAAWKDGESTALSMAVALSLQHGKTLPWATVRQAIDGALRARLLERTESLPLWPCGYPDAASVKVRVPKQVPPGGAGSGEAKYGVKSATAELRANELQDLADAVAKIGAASAGHELKYIVSIELGGDKPAPDAVVEAVNGILGSVSSKLKLE